MSIFKHCPECNKEGFKVILTVVQDLCVRHELVKLKSENEKLKKCVEFYSDERNWGDGGEINGDDCEPFYDDTFEDIGDAINKGGKFARQTLSEIS